MYEWMDNYINKITRNEPCQNTVNTNKQHYNWEFSVIKTLNGSTNGQDNGQTNKGNLKI